MKLQVLFFGLLMMALPSLGQEITGRTWVNADHQTMELDEDTARFQHQGRKELFAYIIDGDKLDLTGAAGELLSFQIEMSGDSLTLHKWVVPNSSEVKTAENENGIRLNLSMKLKDYEMLRFADASSLVKSYDDFESLQFRSNACMGTCPVLDITINSNREVSFKAEAYADHLGTYTSQLDKAQMHQICELVKQGDLQGLKSRLKTPLDFPTYYLTIDYGDEKAEYSGYSLYEPLNQLIQQFLDFDTTLKLKKLE